MHEAAEAPGNARLEAKQDLVGCLMVDSDAPGLQARESLRERKWERREIENYLCQPETLVAYARRQAEVDCLGPLLSTASAEVAALDMDESIPRFASPAALDNPDDPYWKTIKASSDFLERVFKEYSTKRSSPLQMRKADYPLLVSLIPDHLLSPEIREALDMIHATQQHAKPLTTEQGNG
ncbi:MAG: hypothetical protein MUF01_12645 [Bryobacterales bacterium]|nr:hypothetical protein [Bryobacterales bacterium]